MKRRTLLGLVATLSGTTVVGTSAFSSARLTRSVSVEVVGDGSALLQLEPCHDTSETEGLAPSDFVEDTGGTIAIDLTGDNENIEDGKGKGITESSLWRIPKAFRITNAGSQAVCVDLQLVDSDGEPPKVGLDDNEEVTVDLDGDGDDERTITSEDPAVVFYSGIDDSPDNRFRWDELNPGQPDAIHLEPSDSECIGFNIRTFGLSSDSDRLEGLTLRIKADANAGCKEDDTDEEPEPAAGGNLVFGGPAGNSQTVRLLRAQSDGEIRVHDPTGDEENIQAIGPLFDFDSDGSREAPLLKNKNKIVWTDSSDPITLNNKANTDGAPLGAGSFGEFSNALYYAESTNGQSNGDIYLVSEDDDVNISEGIQSIENNSITAKAIAGIADIDDDSSNELVFVDANNGSHEVCYMSEDENGDRSANTTDITVGSSNSVGRPITLNGDTVIPIVTDDGGISLIEYEENGFSPKSVTEDGAAQAPLTAVDIDGDDELEIVYVSTDSNLKFVDNPSGDDPQVVDVEYDGEEVSASSNVGIL